MVCTDVKQTKKLMHIALSHGGGVEVYTRMLIAHTCGHFETVLICPSVFNTRLLPAGSCTVYVEDVPREISLVSDLKAAKRIRKIIKKEKPDIIYCHSSMAGAVGRAAALGLGCKLVYNPHGWSFGMTVSSAKKQFYRLLERLLARVTDRIVAISEYEKRIALENRVCKPEKLRVILNGIELERFRSAETAREACGYKEGDFIIGCCARLSTQKDPVLFAQVAGKIAERCPNARFIWVGDGELRNDFEQALRDNRVFEKTLITGWTDQPEKYISLFDVAVLFSKWEGFGLSLVECLALGKPVVAADVGAISEIISDGENGALCSSREPAVLAERVLSYRGADKHELNRKCAESAQKFSFAATAAETVALIDGL